MASLSSGFLGAEARANAGTAFESALEDLKIKYEKIEEQKQKEAAAEAAAAKEAAAKAKHDENPFAHDADLEKIRLARMKKLKEEQDKRREHLALGHGQYREIVEDEFLTEVTNSKLVVVHFYHRDFERCKIMDKHLRILCKQFIGTKFVHIDAEKSHFFVGKLAIKTLPTLVYFIDGIAKKRQMGFEGLGGDEFKTKSLVVAMKRAGMLGEAGDDVGSESDDDDVAAASDVREGATLAEYRERMRQKILSGGFSDDDDLSDSDAD